MVKTKELTIREKVGQKFILGINSQNIDMIINLIENYHIGGVILYKNNYKTYEEMIEVINRLKLANKNNKIPLFIAIDQEGGRVNRMPDEFKNLKNIYDVSKVSGDLVLEHADIIGTMLSLMGINMNFSPVMDIYNGKNNGLYKRCFYDDVSKNGINYANGLRKKGVIPVIKHFPGHGVTNMDSHFITPYVYNYKKVINKHILSFEDAIRSGVDAIMVGHLVVRKLTHGLPSSISNKFIKKYLREKNKFNGLVITDEINMLSKNIFYKFNYARRAMLSSGDIILIKLKDRDIKIIDKFIKLVEKNKKYQISLDESVERIIRIKEKYEVNDNLVSRWELDGINERIEELNKLIK